MKFWGKEVENGKTLEVKASTIGSIHLTMASLGEVKNYAGNAMATLFLKINGKKLVIGTLSSKNMPQMSYDLVFTDDFELSHNWKYGSVYFCGYKDPTSPFDSSDSENERLRKSRTALELMQKELEADYDEYGKKIRFAGSVSKTTPGKKAKLITPGKTGTEGRKGNVHLAIPHPSKKPSKVPASNDKLRQQTPKYAYPLQIPCESCSKTFNSVAALQSHAKAKHA